MKNRTAHSVYYHPIFAGVSVMILLSAVLTAAVSGMMIKEVIPQTGIQTAGMICAAASALCGSITAARKSESGKLILGVSSGTVFAAILLICNCLFIKSEKIGIPGILLPILMCSVIGSLLSASRKSHIRRKNERIHAVRIGR